jgi:hypothetical protein
LIFFHLFSTFFRLPIQLARSLRISPFRKATLGDFQDNKLLKKKKRPAMKSFIITTVAILFALALTFAGNAQADQLSGWVAQNTWSTLKDDGTNHNVYVTPMRVNNLTTGQENFLLFCGDFRTPTSNAYSSSAGQSYQAYAMGADEVFYTDKQKSMINDIFGHAHAAAFTADGAIIDPVYAQAIQLCVWKVLHEQTDSMNILTGSFALAGNYTSAVVNATNSMLSALAGETSWESLGMGEYTNYDLTVYIAEGGKDVSQTLISVTGSQNRIEAPTDAPEPATMLLIGLGGIGLAAVRRMRR